MESLVLSEMSQGVCVGEGDRQNYCTNLWAIATTEKWILVLIRCRAGCGWGLTSLQGSKNYITVHFG